MKIIQKFVLTDMRLYEMTTFIRLLYASNNIVIPRNVICLNRLGCVTMATIDSSIARHVWQIGFAMGRLNGRNRYAKFLALPNLVY
jgi:hypothetical protein